MPERKAIPIWLSVSWLWLLLLAIVEDYALEHLRHVTGWNLADNGDAVVFCIWLLAQACWLRQRDRRCKAAIWVGIALLLTVAYEPLFYLAPHHRPWNAASIVVAIAALIIWLIAIFRMRLDMMWYFQLTEEPPFRLSGFMTLFFSVYYFQYHFHRLAEKQRSEMVFRPVPASALSAPPGS